MFLRQGKATAEAEGKQQSSDLTLGLGLVHGKCEVLAAREESLASETIVLGI